jgi:hypothetical protein
VLDHPIDRVWTLLRDFDGFSRWHPAIAMSEIERGASAEQIGCVRRLRLADGSEVREQLLTLSDLEQVLSYCLLDTPIPLFNYVAHIRLVPVTDGDRTFWSWRGRFTTRKGEEQAMVRLVAEDIFEAGFAAAGRHLGDAA